MEKLDYEWIERAEREYNNCLTGDLKKEKEAYLRGVQDCFNEMNEQIRELQDKLYGLESEKDDLEDELEYANDKIKDLESDLEDYQR